MSTTPEKMNSSKESEKLEKPSFYDIFYLNDDYTPIDFVVATLKVHFNKTEEEAYALAQQAPVEGKIKVATTTFEIAETKTFIVNHVAQRNGFPLKSVFEKSI